MGRKAVWWITEVILVWVSVILTLASVGTLFASEINPTHWGGGYVLSLLAMPILFVNLFFVFWWLFRRYWSIALISVLGVAVQYQTIGGYFNFRGQKNEPIGSVSSYTIASYNIHEFKGDNNLPGSVAVPLSDMIANNQVDIICFQEFKQAQRFTADTIAKVLEMPYYALAEKGEQGLFYDVAVFSKYPIIDQGIIDIKSPTRVAQWAKIEFPEGVVSVVNCHLQSTELFTSGKMLNQAVKDGNIESIDGIVNYQVNRLIETSKIRAEQSQMIVDYCKGVEGPLLLSGDFNSPPNSFAYNLVVQNFSDSFLYSENLIEPTYSVMKQNLRIDYVFFNTRIFPLSHRTLEIDLSDHYPVLFQFQINAND